CDRSEAANLSVNLRSISQHRFLGWEAINKHCRNRAFRETVFRAISRRGRNEGEITRHRRRGDRINLWQRVNQRWESDAMDHSRHFEHAPAASALDSTSDISLQRGVPKRANRHGAAAPQVQGC